MAAQIVGPSGTIACSYVKGMAVGAGLKQRTMTWFVPGVNGQSALKLGLNEGEFAFTAVLYDTHANVDSWRLTIEGVQGAVCTITDDWGKAWSNCLVTSVSPIRRTPATISAPGCRGELTIRGVVVA